MGMFIFIPGAEQNGAEQSRVEGASSTLTSCSTQTDALIKHPVFREVPQIYMTAVR